MFKTISIVVLLIICSSFLKSSDLIKIGNVSGETVIIADRIKLMEAYNTANMDACKATNVEIIKLKEKLFLSIMGYNETRNITGQFLEEIITSDETAFIGIFSFFSEKRYCTGTCETCKYVVVNGQDACQCTRLPDTLKIASPQKVTSKNSKKPFKKFMNKSGGTCQATLSPDASFKPVPLVGFSVDSFDKYLLRP